MKWKTPLIVLISILTSVLSGCLPSVPKKITGPTWTTKYRIPLINQKRISFGPATEEEDGLDLEDVRINYESSSDVDGPATFNLLDERVTVDPGVVIPDIELAGSPGVCPIDAETGTFYFAGVGNYVRVKLSDEEINFNYIAVCLVDAAAAGDSGLTLELMVKEGEVSQTKEVHLTSGNGADLKIPGLILTPESAISIKASGSINITGSNPQISFTTPVPLEIEEITFDKMEGIQDDPLTSLSWNSLMMRISSSCNLKQQR